ncbi:MAG TPA: DUF378 domain-containing protein [Solirubrobacteraceae bacterium]|nr:DUF378 domain-containing protein [Solirubrobacteraceae bacterium]
MDLLKRLEPLALLLLVIGAVNWLVIGLFDYNFVSKIFGNGTATDVVYVVVGVAALLFVPRLLDGLNISRHHPVHHA